MVPKRTSFKAQSLQSSVHRMLFALLHRIYNCLIGSKRRSLNGVAIIHQEDVWIFFLGLLDQNGCFSQSQSLHRLVLIVVVVDQVGMEVGRCQDTNIDSLSLHGFSVLSSRDIASHSHQSISVSAGIFWGNSRARIRALWCRSSFSRICSSRWFCFRCAAFYWGRISSDCWSILISLNSIYSCRKSRCTQKHNRFLKG